MRPGMTISRAAEQAGVGIETIRFYERRGLIKQPPRPRSGGFRSYDQDAIERICFIRQAQELGFSLREIKELLLLRADPAADCGEVRRQAVVKRAEVEQKIARLRHMRGALDELIASCPGGGALRACSIIDALARQSTRKKDEAATTTQHRTRSTRSREPTPRDNEMKTITIKIGGMYCDGCARTIEALLATEPGVRKASVSFDNQEARVLFEPQSVKEQQIAAAVQRAGYAIKKITS